MTLSDKIHEFMQRDKPYIHTKDVKEFIKETLIDLRIMGDAETIDRFKRRAGPKLI